MLAEQPVDAATFDQARVQVVARALAWSVVIVPATEVDQRGLHVCNLAAMRRALASLQTRPEYVLTDGFGVDGLGVPGLAVWKGDRVAACVAAASVLAKVTRDRIMVDLHDRFPDYGFAEHKGYITDDHTAALTRHGPCAEHRFSYVNVLQRDMCPSQTRFESEIIAMTLDMLHGDAARARGLSPCGVIGSGGSESILSAIYTHREWARTERGVTAPEMILRMSPPDGSAPEDHVETCPSGLARIQFDHTSSVTGTATAMVSISSGRPMRQ